ncbi:MAG: DUF4249 family protein, partial [Cytophagales bacterium]
MSRDIWKKLLVRASIFILLNGCVERIYFDLPEDQLQIVVEGMISDNPGPYSVKVSKGFSLEADTSSVTPMSGLSITLSDDVGNKEAFVEQEPGIYLTGGVMRGQIGRSYHIIIATASGKIFESIPDPLNETGEIDSIRHEFEARTVVKPYGESKADVFNVFIDATSIRNRENYTRWKFTGTYKAITRPELNLTTIQGYAPFRDPYPCSGYVITLGPEGSGGVLEKRGDCTCCSCWPKDFEVAPQISDAQLVVDNKYNNIKVGEIKINSATFNEKYLIEVEQMSLSRKAFDFFKLVRDQKLNASSLFQ